MQDIIKQILEEVRAIWRFRWHALAAAWGVCVLGWLVVLMLPDRYEASARVIVDPSTVLRPVIQRLAVEQDVNAELNLVCPSLLSDSQLQWVIKQTGLAAGATRQRSLRVVEILLNSFMERTRAGKQQVT
jgi:uncharacterized protein involved in exopolysaccharide biosynthesis